MYRSYAEDLKEASGIDVEYRDEGTLFVVLRGDDEEEKTKWTRWQLDAGLSLELLSSDEVRKLEPAVANSAVLGIFLSEEHQIENRRLMDALDVVLKQAGVEVIEGTEVTAISNKGDTVTGVQTSRGNLSSGGVVVAAGTWSSYLLEPLGLKVEVIPARGQMIAVKGDFSINRVLHSSDVYVVPRRDGRILIGATVEYAGFRKAVTARGVSKLISAAVQISPSLAGCEIVEIWSGLRPDTPDHLPLLGPAGPDGLTLATGHFRNGILLAPVTADLIATYIIHNKKPVELIEFGVERFAANQAMKV
jgi:glycine oxidase